MNHRLFFASVIFLTLTSLPLSSIGTSATAAPGQRLSRAEERCRLAFSMIESDHILEGRAVLIPLCHKSDTTAEMYCLLARTYIQDPEQDPKMNGEIVGDLLQSIKLDPEYGTAYRYMAQFYNVQGQWQEALKYADKALKVKKPDFTALKERTGTYSSMNRYNEALASIDQFHKLFKPSDTTLFSRATLLEQLKRYPEAVADYRLSLSLRNQDTTVFHLARCLELMGKYGDAIAELTKLLKVNAKDGEALALRARLAGKNKNLLMALSDYTKAIALEPTYKLYNERAAIYAQLGQTAAASRDLKEAKELQEQLKKEPFSF